MRRLLLAAAGAVALAAIANVLSTRPEAVALKPLLALDGKYDVRILRDEFGVAHSYGRRDADTTSISNRSSTLPVLRHRRQTLS
jgi:penicillin amidase/acyl-homoserine-lactone acylase